MKSLTLEVWTAAVVVTTAMGMVTGCGISKEAVDVSEPAPSESYLSRSIELTDAAGEVHKGVALTTRSADDRLDILLSSATAISRPQGAGAPYAQRLKQAQDMMLAAVTSDPRSDVTAIVMQEDKLGWSGRPVGAQQVDSTEPQPRLYTYRLYTYTNSLNAAYFSGTYICNGVDVTGWITNHPTSTAIVTMSLMSGLPPNGTAIAIKTGVQNGSSPINKWCLSGDGTTGNCGPWQTAYYHVKQLQTNAGNFVNLHVESWLSCY